MHVSADNRYKLFVNGTLVSLGPARGDLTNWNYETVDIAQYLVVGKNAIAALVWNEGSARPGGADLVDDCFYHARGNPTPRVS
ncbi:MAG: hypothetical protein WDO15_27660 [Bacteroidota bacterium]